MRTYTEKEIKYMYDVTNTFLGQDAGGVWSKRVWDKSGQERQCEYKRKIFSALMTLIHTNRVQNEEDKYNIR